MSDSEKRHPSKEETPVKQGGELVKSDPLQRYMAEIRHHPLLSPEEEHALAVRYYETGDIDAAQRLALGNLRLVVKIAFDFVRLYQNALDLIQEGNIGLMQAIKRFDPFKGVKLSTYAAWWIRAYILKYIMNNYRIYKIGTTEAQKKLFYKLNREMEKLAIAGEVTPKLLAEHFDVREADVLEMQQILKDDDLSLDAPVADESKTPFAHFFSSGERPVDEVLADQELLRLFDEKLKEFSRTLNKKERAVMERRLLADPPETLQELGDALHVSRERIRQIEKKVITKLKEFLAPYDAFSDIEIGKKLSGKKNARS
ncbi:MAG: RNA polymerase factor sigma-32 [bacterium]|nr:RNA polymerase factor sigma-32 [bacterium]